MSFNKQQTEAINLSKDTNVLISAGAGSGKTATLSEKVLRMIETEEIKPSQLLVLTFTNNAAHSMKMKIQKKFMNKDNSKFKDQMLSSHIQTFDSFMQYLVKSHASDLQISDSFTIANDTLMAVKKEEFLDEIFNDYFTNHHEVLAKMISKYSFVDEKPLKEIITYLYFQLNKLTPSQKNKVLHDYDSNYFTKEFYTDCVNKLYSLCKDNIIVSLKLANFANNNFKKEDDENVDLLNKLNMLLYAYKSYRNTYECDVKAITFKDDIEIDLYKKILTLLECKTDSFFNEYNNVVNYIVTNKLTSKRGSSLAFKLMCYPFTNKNFLSIKSLSQLSNDIESDFNKYMSLKDDVHFFLDILNKLYFKLKEYKDSNQLYTFSDIAEMASILLADKKFEHVCDELKSTYKYIMIDEYQDTNDSQEIFINTLLEKSKDGTFAKVFCVGDAKQSIYAFRNSNVELFRARQEKYNNSDDSKVIYMNTNYRSGKKLLDDINYIFKFYMTLDHGGINYLDDSEQLKYDDKANIYGLDYDGFGIERIISQCGDDDNNSIYDYEILAIIDDIQTKIKNEYLIYDKDEETNKIRPCKYSDFCILTRNKSTFELFQKYFNVYSIPLNVKLSSELTEQQPIIVLTSLLNLIKIINSNDKADIISIKHLLCSLARSYIYNKDDNYVQNIISSNDIFNNDIYLEIKNFVKVNRNNNSIIIFDSLLNDFKMISNLSLLKNVNNSINKLESLRNIFASQVNIGYGIDNFVSFLENMSYYKVLMKDDSTFAIENAVDLMTIHASKGLEKKIVYMPLSTNKLARGNNMIESNCDFSLDYGILLPDYDIEYEDVKNNIDYQKNILTIPYILYKNLNNETKVDIDEHVRLLYVALTRAQNKVIIVGDKVSQGSKETLYDMLNACPSKLYFDENEINNLIKLNMLDSKTYDTFLKISEIYNSFKIEKVDFNLDSHGKKLSKLILNELINPTIKQILNELINKIKISFFRYYLSKLEIITNEDILAKLYGYSILKIGYVTSLNDLNKKIKNKIKPIDSIEEEDDFTTDSDEISINLNTEVTDIEEVTSKDLLEFKTELLQYINSDEIEIKPATFFDSYLLGLAYALNDVKKLFYVSYKTKNFNDITRIFNINSMPINNNSNIQITINKTIDNSEIIFKERSKSRASKEKKDEDIEQIILDRGTYLHQLLENVNLKTKDTSFIVDKKDRELINNVLNLNIFSDLSNAKIYKEYGYYDNNLNTTGFIDLLIIKNNTYYIIDYKTSNFDDPEYINQLDVYKRNIVKIFNIKENQVKMFLLSILKCQIKELK